MDTQWLTLSAASTSMLASLQSMYKNYPGCSSLCIQCLKQLGFHGIWYLKIKKKGGGKEWGDKVSFRLHSFNGHFTESCDMHFCRFLEHSLLNIHHNRECFRQKCRGESDAHFMPSTFSTTFMVLTLWLHFQTCGKWTDNRFFKLNRIIFPHTKTKDSLYCI
jgi:hypothetical protein